MTSNPDITTLDGIESLIDIETAPAGESAVAPRRPRLRVGLFAADRCQPKALVEAFAGLANSSFADVVLVAIGQRAASRPPWLWRVYGQLDALVFGRGQTASEPVDLLTRFSCMRILALPDEAPGKPAADAWRAEIAKLRLDVVFLLGDVADVLLSGLARHGVWRFVFGDGQQTNNGLEGFREVASGQPVSSLSLLAKLPGERERLLYRSMTRTLPFSLVCNRDKLLRRAAQFPARALAAVHRAPGALPETASIRLDPAPSAEPPMHARTSALGSMLRGSARIVRRGAQKLLSQDQWFIGWRFAQADIGPPETGPFACLVPPPDRFWADPFPCIFGGRYFIFFEEYLYSTGKAHISVVEIGRDGRCSPVQKVLERPYHLSYPFLVDGGGELFMVPETADNGSVELYRCERFPDRWRLERVLLRAGFCADATLHRGGDRWWMFVNIGNDGRDVHDELFIFHADRLDGKWQQHPANPVRSDVRCARPAGRLFRQGGDLYRPAQIGTPLYGSGISLNRVGELTPESYSEQEVARLVPAAGSGILGIHTLNRAGALTVVDGFFRRRRLNGMAPTEFTPQYIGGREAHDARVG